MQSLLTAIEKVNPYAHADRHTAEVERGKTLELNSNVSLTSQSLCSSNVVLTSQGTTILYKTILQQCLPKRMEHHLASQIVMLSFILMVGNVSESLFLLQSVTQWSVGSRRWRWETVYGLLVLCFQTVKTHYVFHVCRYIWYCFLVVILAGTKPCSIQKNIALQDLSRSPCFSIIQHVAFI